MPFPTGTSRRRVLTAALLALGLTVASSGCNSGSDSGGTPGTIKIGLLASLSGTYEAVGTEIDKASERLAQVGVAVEAVIDSVRETDRVSARCLTPA